ncbi:MAG: MmgE/PrpD family protein, partial [Proteobacteria bacterium]|nr:MmgE/PrpD family protein [Pseudomonadota bacterium]
VTMQAATNMNPTTGLAGKFSVPYCVANALLRDVTGMGAFTDELVNDPAVRELMAKIVVEKDPVMAGLESRVVVRTKDGREFTGVSDILAQIPPLEDKQVRVRAKFLDLVSPVLGQARALEVAEMVEGLEEVADISQVAERL